MQVAENQQYPKGNSDWIAWVVIALIVIFGSHLRVFAYIHTQVDSPIRADAREYFGYALNLENWNVFSKDFVAPGSPEGPKADAMRSPGFPYFGKFFATDDVENMLANTLKAQTALQVLSFLLLTLVFVRVLGVNWAIPAALVLWTFPHFISINTYYLSESLFTSLLAIAVSLAWYASQKKERLIAGMAVCGLVFSMAALTRPVVEHFPLFMLLACVLLFRNHWKAVLAFAFMAMVPVLLWKLRNILAVGETSDPTLMINGFYHGSFPGFMYNHDPASFGFPYAFDPRQNEMYQGLGTTLSIIAERAAQSPAEYLQWYLWDKPQVLWQWDNIAGPSDIFIYPMIKSPYFFLPDFHATHVLNHEIHSYWVALGVVTAVWLVLAQMVKKNNASLFLLFLALIVIYATLVHMVLAPFPRYGIPFKVCLITLSVLAIKESSSWVLQQLAKKSQ